VLQTYRSHQCGRVHEHSRLRRHEGDRALRDRVAAGGVVAERPWVFGRGVREKLLRDTEVVGDRDAVFADRVARWRCPERAAGSAPLRAECDHHAVRNCGRNRRAVRCVGAGALRAERAHVDRRAVRLAAVVALARVLMDAIGGCQRMPSMGPAAKPKGGGVAARSFGCSLDAELVDLLLICYPHKWPSCTLCSKLLYVCASSYRKTQEMGKSSSVRAFASPSRWPAWPRCAQSSPPAACRLPLASSPGTYRAHRIHGARCSTRV